MSEKNSRQLNGDWINIDYLCKFIEKIESNEYKKSISSKTEFERSKIGRIVFFGEHGPKGTYSEYYRYCCNKDCLSGTIPEFNQSGRYGHFTYKEHDEGETIHKYLCYVCVKKRVWIL